MLSTTPRSSIYLSLCSYKQQKPSHSETGRSVKGKQKVCVLPSRSQKQVLQDIEKA
ncbi:hypothetical protein ENTCAN_08873 [Enterobacter cancerogenus ATCC 35316]|nr:hypothetical protein ENTCAN_08873 [Enterobacter cancerogenus ATCC 35316]